MGKRYSASVSASSTVSDEFLELLEGITVEFWDSTGFTIAARSARACTADPAGLAARYFVFTNLCPKYDLDV